MGVTCSKLHINYGSIKEHKILVEKKMSVKVIFITN